MRYIKFENDIAVEAPFKKVTATGTIFGYNAPSNEAMLIADGYLAYDGGEPLSCLKLVDGQIVEMPVPEPEQMQKTYTKLQIRRALRRAGKEEMLDALLESNEQARKDWNDCIEVSFEDEMLNAALTDELKAQLISILEAENVTL